MAREHTKIVEIDGDNYRITDFDALSGGKMFVFVTKKVIPLLNLVDVELTGLLQQGAEESLKELARALLPVLDNISNEDIETFMKLCLEQVEIELPAGYEKVMRNGEFVIDKVKYSTKLAFTLCYHAVSGVIADFFGENALSSIEGMKKKNTRKPSQRT